MVLEEKQEIFPVMKGEESYLLYLLNESITHRSMLNQNVERWRMCLQIISVRCLKYY